MLRAAHAQHLGGRDHQHDSVFSQPGLHVVADGNGVLGDCSAKAIELFRRHLADARAAEAALDRALATAIRHTADDLCAYLEKEIATALDELRMQNTEALAMLGPAYFETELSSGSTIVAFVDDTHVVHVGDSRAYRVTPARTELHLLTRDHVWTEDDDTVDVNGTVYKHGLAMQRVLGHPVLHPLGVTSEPDITPVTLGDGDLLLLCSDGLRPFLERPGGIERLCELLARPIHDAVSLVIDEARALANDNVSLILVGR